MNHVIVWLVFIQPFVDHLMHIENQQKLKAQNNDLSLICELTKPKVGYQKAIYNRMDCLTKMSKSSVKA